MADSNTRVSFSFSHLSSVLKRDQGGFLRDYLKEQRSLLSYYASQGPPALGGPVNKDRTRVGLPPDGFGTPVLKARAAVGSGSRRCRSEASTDSNDRCSSPKFVSIPAPSKSKGGLRSNTKESQRTKTGPEKKKQDGSAAKKKSEVIHIIDSDEDSTTERLAERRERRREKREIVKEPVKGVVDDSDKENENDNTANGRTGTKYLSKKKGGRPQAPGLALMHGFSSKAVGKNRLTMDIYARSVGVFNRGKASERTKVNSGLGFLESAFLDRRMKRRSRSKEPEDSSDLPPKHKKSQKVKKTGALLQKEQREQSHVDQDMTSDAAPSKRAYDPAESVVWDIEKESDVLDKVTAAGDGGHESFILPVPSYSRTKDLVTNHHAGKSCRRSRSIGPSQSASQINVDDGSPKLSHAQLASKYFPPPPARSDCPQQSTGHALLLDMAKRSVVQQNEEQESSREHARGEEEESLLQEGPGPAVAERHLDAHKETEAIRRDLSDGDESILFDRDLLYSMYPADFFPSSEVSLLDQVDGAFGMDWEVEDTAPHYYAYIEPEEVNSWEEPCHQPLEDVPMDDVINCGWREGWDIDDEEDRYGPSYGDEHIEVQYADTPIDTDALDRGEDGLELDSFDDAEEKLGPLEVFRQGRALLYGLSPETPQASLVAPRLSGAEADVARTLGGSHWVPYRLG